MRRRVVITGLGALTPVGKSPEEQFQNLMAGQSGIRRLQLPFIDQLDIRIGAQVPDYNPADYFSKIKLSGIERFSQFALIAAAQAVADAKLELAEHELTRAGVFMGTGLGGASTMEEGYEQVFLRDDPRVKPLSVLLSMNNAAASHLSLTYKLQGANVTYSTACASSAIAIGEAYRQIKHGYADVMLAGGSEALLTFGAMKAWEALRTLATEDVNDPASSCKPFSKDRNGLVLGEGAAVLVLEDAERALARGARIYAEIVGYDCSSDASHITKPDSLGQTRAINNALRDAGLQPQDIGYINAHGTATQAGDIEETRAIKAVFGEHAANVPVSSTKSMHGHLMGATGAVEFMVAVQALQHQAIPPTINLHQPDPACDLDYVANVGRRDVPLEVVMSNSFAFGGTNAVLIARRFAP
ncbi:3-oxoacyl-[acyl-carrier-protein] synthase 2 [Ferriphaselus amnicola]|uniref:3-oxoacyl-[acyl-carrier-protein] synthase 2 n=1 Tax=Ferriphaselus amnicola TaxID=1188319 RepID=A0A2Z6GG13_9PROT|nr:beta-ketoacyl-[acyl-carrier-protein] synthase family protein [Ferriphaselus amnicola]BBE52224.1 3-oxoacyl-[acyl-carrier-protein] synthase 2 [Ferriphaselus amnicola]